MLISVYRTVIVFAVLMAAMRIMGKRQLGELEPSELAVTVLISELAANPLQSQGGSLLHGLVPVAALLVCELLLSGYMLRSIRFRSFLCGKPSLIIENGRIRQNEMRKNRLTADELCEALRSKGVSDINTVRFAVLETNGTLSVLTNAADSPLTPKVAGIPIQESGYPVILISCGRILDGNLKVLGKTRGWLNELLCRHGCPDPKNIYLLQATENGAVFLQENDPSP